MYYALLFIFFGFFCNSIQIVAENIKTPNNAKISLNSQERVKKKIKKELPHQKKTKQFFYIFFLIGCSIAILKYDYLLKNTSTFLNFLLNYNNSNNETYHQIKALEKQIAILQAEKQTDSKKNENKINNAIESFEKTLDKNNKKQKELIEKEFFKTYKPLEEKQNKSDKAIKRFNQWIKQTEGWMKNRGFEGFRDNKNLLQRFNSFLENVSNFMSVNIRFVYSSTYLSLLILVVFTAKKLYSNASNLYDSIKNYPIEFFSKIFSFVFGESNQETQENRFTAQQNQINAIVTQQTENTRQVNNLITELKNTINSKFDEVTQGVTTSNEEMKEVQKRLEENNNKISTETTKIGETFVNFRQENTNTINELETLMKESIEQCKKAEEKLEKAAEGAVTIKNCWEELKSKNDALLEKNNQLEEQNKELKETNSKLTELEKRIKNLEDQKNNQNDDNISSEQNTNNTKKTNSKHKKTRRTTKNTIMNALNDRFKTPETTFRKIKLKENLTQNNIVTDNSIQLDYAIKNKKNNNSFD